MSLPLTRELPVRPRMLKSAPEVNVQAIPEYQSSFEIFRDRQILIPLVPLV